MYILVSRQESCRGRVSYLAHRDNELYYKQQVSYIMVTQGSRIFAHESDSQHC